MCSSDLIKWLPKKSKLEVINKYENSNIPSKYYLMTTGYLKNNLELPDNEEMIKLFIKRMDSFDRVRKIDWKNTFPEVVDLIKDYL